MRVCTPVRAVVCVSDQVWVRDHADRPHLMDAVVIATHANQALALLADATVEEQRVGRPLPRSAGFGISLVSRCERDKHWTVRVFLFRCQGWWMPPTDGVDAFDAMIEHRQVTAAFQPVVDFDRDEVVGFEALARPPVGSGLAGPRQMFAEAYRSGRVAELDWVCRAAALSALLRKQIPSELPLLINVEPAALDAPCPPDIAGLVDHVMRRNRFVVEVTERALVKDPAGLVAAVDRLRDASIGVALDDVGAESASLALMPALTPDVVKVDLSLIQQRPSPEIARIVNAVLAETERTGATILAEGVETSRHLDVARAMGATLGQGLLFGALDAFPWVRGRG